MSGSLCTAVQLPLPRGTALSFRVLAIPVPSTSQGFAETQPRLLVVLHGLHLDHGQFCLLPNWGSPSLASVGRIRNRFCFTW